MVGQTCRMALKEWAVAVQALDAGRQILLMRKGGIREEGKEFRVIYPEFLLYPTYEHQKEELLREPFHTELRQVLAESNGQEDTITLSHWAQIHEVIEVTDQAKVDELSSHYIWTTDYAQKRLHWKPRKSLTLMLLRVYRLAQPQKVPVLPHYGGCKSWVELDREVPLGHLEPVLSLEAFQREVEEIRGVLGLRGSPV